MQYFEWLDRLKFTEVNKVEFINEQFLGSFSSLRSSRFRHPYIGSWVTKRR